MKITRIKINEKAKYEHYGSYDTIYTEWNGSLDLSSIVHHLERPITI